jgi:thioredoxin
MDIKLKNSVFVCMLGLLGYVILACNASAEAKNELDSSVQKFVQEPVVVAENQETTQKPIVLSEEQFAKLVVDFTSSDKKFKGKKPCIIDFYADWCHPCRVFSPIFEKMAEKYGDKVSFYKVNVDNCKNLSNAYNITNIPTLFFFDKKGTLSQAVGVPSEEDFENAVKMIM